MLAKTLLRACTLAAAATAVEFTVRSSGGNATSPYQYGLMFEDINHSGDGGVYAELVSNRAFQGNKIFPSNLAYWYSIGGAELALANLSAPLSSALPTSLMVTAKGSADQIGFWNEGTRDTQFYITNEEILTLDRILGFPDSIVVAIRWLVLHVWRLLWKYHCRSCLQHHRTDLRRGLCRSFVDLWCMVAISIHVPTYSRCAR